MERSRMMNLKNVHGGYSQRLCKALFYIVIIIIIIIIIRYIRLSALRVSAANHV
jgi:hypothetical protein